jgi:hypothetical protein
VEEPSAIMERSRSIDPAKIKKVMETLINLPDLKVPQAMILADSPTRRLRIFPCVASSGNLSPARW